MTNTTGGERSSTSDALQVIRELAAAGHANSYIAQALNLRGIPTVTGRGRWESKGVYRLAQAHGIALGYRR